MMDRPDDGQDKRPDLHDEETATSPETASDERRGTQRRGGAPSDYMANERTLLAWARTGIAVIGLGFVVARFGLLIRELAGKHVTVHSPAGVSNALGTALVATGAVLLALALARYLQSARAIARNQYEWSPWLGVLLGLSLIAAAVMLVIYLLLTG